jgi:hypothetical protein
MKQHNSWLLAQGAGEVEFTISGRCRDSLLIPIPLLLSVPTIQPPLLVFIVLLLCTFPVDIIPINSWGCVTIWMYDFCWHNLILGV